MFNIISLVFFNSSDAEAINPSFLSKEPQNNQTQETNWGGRAITWVKTGFGKIRYCLNFVYNYLFKSVSKNSTTEGKLDLSEKNIQPKIDGVQKEYAQVEEKIEEVNPVLITALRVQNLGATVIEDEQTNVGVKIEIETEEVEGELEKKELRALRLEKIAASIPTVFSEEMSIKMINKPISEDEKLAKIEMKKKFAQLSLEAAEKRKAFENEKIESSEIPKTENKLAKLPATNVLTGLDNKVSQVFKETNVNSITKNIFSLLKKNKDKFKGISNDVIYLRVFYQIINIEMKKFSFEEKITLIERLIIDRNEISNVLGDLALETSSELTQNNQHNRFLKELKSNYLKSEFAFFIEDIDSPICIKNLTSILKSLNKFSYTIEVRNVMSLLLNQLHNLISKSNSSQVHIQIRELEKWMHLGFDLEIEKVEKDQLLPDDVFYDESEDELDEKLMDQKLSGIAYSFQTKDENKDVDEEMLFDNTLNDDEFEFEFEMDTIENDNDENKSKIKEHVREGVINFEKTKSQQKIDFLKLEAILLKFKELSVTQMISNNESRFNGNAKILAIKLYDICNSLIELNLSVKELFNGVQELSPYQISEKKVILELQMECENFTKKLYTEVRFKTEELMPLKPLLDLLTTLLGIEGAEIKFENDSDHDLELVLFLQDPRNIHSSFDAAIEAFYKERK